MNESKNGPKDGITRKVVRFFKGEKVEIEESATAGNGSPNTTGEFEFPGDKKPEEGASDETTPITKAGSGEQPLTENKTLPAETPPSSKVKVDVEVQVTPPSQPTQPAEPVAPGEEKQPTIPKKQTKQTTIKQPVKEVLQAIDVTQKNKEKMLKEPVLKFIKHYEKICKQLGDDFARILSLIVKKIEKINANILSVSAEIQRAQKDAEKNFDDLLKELDEAKKILS